MTDLRSTIPALIARRNVVGAKSPEGRHISLLNEQLRSAAPAEFIWRTLREIEQIQKDGGRYVHEHHGVGR